MIGGSLFSGIEGFGLGLLWSGLISTIAWQVEIDPFCRRVLERWFPDADRSVQDVRSASSARLRAVDILFGGPPCQDVSGAGKGEGLTGARSGLVAEMLRLADELRPPIVLIENVASGARRWVCPVRGSLEALGYRTAALNIGVDDCGGPHRRRRVFILAYTERDVLRLQPGRRGWTRGPRKAEPCGGGEGLADAHGDGQSQPQGDVSRERGRVGHGRKGLADPHGARLQRPDFEAPGGLAWPTECDGLQGAPGIEPAMGPRADGIPDRVVRWPAPPGPQASWEPPRVLASVPKGYHAGLEGEETRVFIQGVTERAAKLKALGNAVSPVQAYYVGLWAKDVLSKEVRGIQR